MTAPVGRRPEKALTAQQVKHLTKPGKYFDGNGLYLRVDANGSRFWVQRIVVRGRRCEIGLGSPALVTLAEARARALANRKVARDGGDPLQAKKASLAVYTFEEAAREVHRLHTPTWRNKKHAQDFINSLEMYVFPRIGRMRTSELSAADVLAVLTPIWLPKQETARRVRQRIGMVLKWAIAQGWRSDNPAENISHALPKQTREKEQRKSLPYENVAACIAAVKNSGARLETKLALEFTVHTVLRSIEVREAVWSEINFVENVWEVPGPRMKLKKPHRVPLSKRAVEILREAQKLSRGDNPFVFPGTKAGRPLSDMTLSKLIKELGFNVDVHGFRASFRTWTQEQTEFPREVAEAALAHHTGDQSERAYARSDFFEKRRKMMDAWSGFIEGESNPIIPLEGQS